MLGNEKSLMQCVGAKQLNGSCKEVRLTGSLQVIAKQAPQPANGRPATRGSVDRMDRTAP